MSERRRTSVALIAVAALLCIVLATLGTYVSGYFFVSVLRTPPSHDIPVRDFNHRWQAELYLPLVKVESMIRGQIEASWMADP